MTIFTCNLRRLFKNKFQLLIIIVLPMIILLLGSMNTFTDTAKQVIGIVDDDKTDYTAMLRNGLASQVMPKDVTSDDIQDVLINSKVDYVVVFEKGFTSKLIKGEDVQPKGYYRKDSFHSITVKQYLESSINSAKLIAKATGGNEQKFYDAMKRFNDPPLRLVFTVDTEIERQKSYAVLGTLILIMMVTATMYSSLIITNKDNKTLYRTLSAPVTIVSYMLQTISSFLVVSLIQLNLMFVVFKGILGIYLGESILNMYLLFVVAAVVAVSLGVAISSVTRSVLQAALSGVFIGFLMSMVGGVWWSNDMSSKLIQSIGKFTPVYWIMDGVEKLLKEQSIYSISGDILIILLFATVFFFLGTWRKADITA